GDPYYLEGGLDFLAEPGQWCLDSNAGMLYYLPRPGEAMDKAEVIAPVLTQVVRLEGQPEQVEFIDHIRFKGLTFSHAEWYFPEGFASNTRLGLYPPPRAEVAGFVEADIGVPAAVSGQGVRNCSWKDCSFTHLGTYGLELSVGCQHDLISRCVFTDMAGGAKLGGGVPTRQSGLLSGDNEISDCHIFDGGQLFHSAVGIWLGQTANNRIVHNLIHDFYSTAVCMGWTFGYYPSQATNNLFAFNHVHHLGIRSNGEGPIMSDMGAIYTLGIQPGTRILNNLIHHVAGLRYGGWGIYLDEGSSSIVAQSNVVYRTTHGAFHLNFGATNALVNNIFAFGRDCQIDRTQPEKHLSLVFMRNIVYFDSGKLLIGDWSQPACRVDGNLYWDTRLSSAPENFKFGNSSLKQWQDLGNDVHSLVANPNFHNPSLYDFTLATNSPAFRMAFEPIDLSQVGIRPKR
ncbi:MAG TPA: right-handed parallel beta-helix repeat-containing protein, partial [Verrucomicrobiae bacterium]|nr:right-handed parallel beta-helix repeat-containing protein [Verrucomicrobiae bacterium]